jgi:hypothetical protein
MKKMLVLACAFLLFMFLRACNPPDQTVTPPTIQPEETATAFVAPPSATATATPEVPTATSEVASATPETPHTPTYEECNQEMDFTLLGDWALCDPWADPVTVMNPSNEIRQFSYALYYGTAIPYPCTRLQSFTEDGNYLYFSLEADCILTEPGLGSSLAVFRMDLLNGEVDEILPAFYNFASGQGNYYTVSISPTGRRMAYIMQEDPPLFLNVLDLQTGEKSSFRLDEKYQNGGAYSWSEDGTRLVFMLESEVDYEYFISMAFLDLRAEDSPVTFLHDQEYNWIASTIEITDAGVNVSPPGGEALFYEIESGVLRPAE